MNAKSENIQMSKFNNKTFEALVKDLINDAFYVESRSNRGKIATIRQYSEVVVRRILNISNEKYLTLGDKNILSKLKNRSENNVLLLEALRNICKYGNDCTHSQRVEEITEEDFNKVMNNLFELFSYLLIDYFEKYEFGSNQKVVSAFSILPPIIRYITLKNLNDKYPENISIIDKLTLSILKAFNKEEALNWIEEQKDFLIRTSSVDKNAIKNIESMYGKILVDEIVNNAPNMYDLCTCKINAVSNSLDKNGKMYDDFESAISFYKERGRVDGSTEEILEFNSIMEFLYLGRKEKVNELLQEDSYLVIDNIF